jgi:hypothetical protein
MHKYGLKGIYKIDVIDSITKKVVKSTGLHNNLILNQGIDYIAQRSFVENILYCCVGGGTLPPLFTDIGLASELARTGNVDSSTNCSTSLVGNVYSLTKIFTFPISQGVLSIGEIGWSYSSSIGNNLFSKALVQDFNGNYGPLIVYAQQYIRVQYTLQISLSPTSSTAGASNIPDWVSSNGTYCLQFVGLKNISSNGAVGYYDAGNDCNEPSSVSVGFLSTSNSALSSFGSSTNRSAGTNYIQNISKNYLGSGLLYKQISFGKFSAISSNINSMGVGTGATPYTNSGFVFVFNSAQTKASGYLLPLKFIYSWARM